MGLAMLSGGWALDARDFWLPLLHLALLAVTALAATGLGGTGLGLDLLRTVGAASQRQALRRAAEGYGGLGLAWLGLSAVILYAAFPVGQGVVLAALRWPVTVMLLGILLRLALYLLAANRGDGADPPAWERYGLALTALAVTLGQGYTLGVVMSGFRTGYAYAILASGIAVCVLAAYLLLAAGRIIANAAEEDARSRAARWARLAAWLVAAGVAAGSVTVPLTNLTVLHRWLAPSVLAYMAMVPVLTLLAFATLEFSLRRLDGAPGWRAVPSGMALLIVVLVFVGVGYSLFPYLIPGRLTVWEAAAAGDALSVLVPGVVAAVVILAGFSVMGARRVRRGPHL